MAYDLTNISNVYLHYSVSPICPENESQESELFFRSLIGINKLYTN